MKSLFLSLSFLAFSFLGFAQIPAGTMLLGGSVGVSYQKFELSPQVQRSFGFTLSPRIGKAVKDNVVNGFELSYSFSEIKGNNQPTYTSQLIQGSVFKQKYLPLGKGFMVFGEGSLGAGFGWDNVTNSNSYNFFAGLGAGIAYNANNKILITVSNPRIVYGYTNFLKYKGNDGFNFNAGMNTTASFNNLQAGILLMR